MLQTAEILLVEDYEPDAHFFQLMLKRNFISNKLHLLDDGRAALDFIFGAGKFVGRSPEQFSGVVIMDIRLPKVDGWEVLRQLREDPRTHELPVIMTSGSIFDEEREIARRMGATACLPKPIRFEPLRDVLDQCGFVWAIAEKQVV